jgi:hypothetical protein
MCQDLRARRLPSAIGQTTRATLQIASFALGVVPHESRRLHQDVLRAARSVVEGPDEVLLLIIGPQRQIGLRRDAAHEREHVLSVTAKILVGHMRNLQSPVRGNPPDLLARVA